MTLNLGSLVYVMAVIEPHPFNAKVLEGCGSEAVVIPDIMIYRYYIQCHVGQSSSKPKAGSKFKILVSWP